MPVTRATSSATNRSRPKKKPASPASKEASPLYGQATMRSPAVRAAWSSSTPPATSSSAARSSAVAAARPTAASSRRAASARAHSATVPAPRGRCPGPGSPRARAAAPAQARCRPARPVRGGAPVCGESVGLAAAAVQREHALGVQALAQRLLRDDRVDLGEDLELAAGREVGVDRELERPQPQLLEPADLGGRERLVGDVIERRAAPQRERLARLALRAATAQSGRRRRPRARAAARIRGRA